MTTQNLGNDINRVYPGMFSQFLSILTQEMKRIKIEAKKIEAMNDSVKGIYEHLTIINNAIDDMMNEKFELAKIIPEKKIELDQKGVTKIHKKFHF
jgi:hypothetical protein